MSGPVKRMYDIFRGICGTSSPVWSSVGNVLRKVLHPLPSCLFVVAFCCLAVLAASGGLCLPRPFPARQEGLLSFGGKRLSVSFVFSVAGLFLFF